MEGQSCSTSGICGFCSLGYKDFFNKAQKIIKNPVTCWDELKQDSSSMKEVYQNFTICLGLFILFTGIVSAAFLYPIPFISKTTAIAWRVREFIFFLAAPFIGSYLIEFLSPKFSGEKDRMKGFKLLAYSQAPGIISAVISLLPIGYSLRALAMVAAGIYSLRIFFAGISPMLSIPNEKRWGFFASLVGCFIVIAIAVNFILRY